MPSNRKTLGGMKTSVLERMWLRMLELQSAFALICAGLVRFPWLSVYFLAFRLGAGPGRATGHAAEGPQGASADSDGSGPNSWRARAANFGLTAWYCCTFVSQELKDEQKAMAIDAIAVIVNMLLLLALST